MKEITKEMYLLAKEIVENYEQSEIALPQLKFVEIKEIGKEYYWKRKNWKPEFSGMIKIVKEGGSHRVKGWQVKYLNDETKILCNKHTGLTYTTEFANNFGCISDLINPLILSLRE